MIILFSSCNITSSLQDNEKLLVKNKIVFKEKVKNKSRVVNDLEILTYQKPNNKLFYLFPVKLAIYNLANKNKRPERKFGWWVKNKLGEPPVVFKEPLVAGTRSSMKNYMFNLGFLHNKVESKIEYKKKKVFVTYIIKPSVRYTVNQIKLPKKVGDISRIISKADKKSLLKEGDFLNINVLDDERKRMTAVLRNNGYYFFNKEFIQFDIDTLGLGEKVNLKMKLVPPDNPNGFKKFKISDVYIYTDYYIEDRNWDLQIDTIDYEGYHFVSSEKKFLNKPILLGVFIKKGDYYSFENHEKTIKKIFSFGAFKYVNIDYEINSKGQLNVKMLLTPSKRQAISGDLELSHSFDGLSGAGVSVTYRNKNLTKRSDLLQFKVSGGVELNLFSQDSSNILNSADFTAELDYYLNKFIVPFPLKNISKNSNVKTKFSLKYNYENRFERFIKHSTSFSAGYEWNETQTKKHFYNPFSVSLLLIPEKHETFQSQLDSLPSLAHSFEENIIFGSNYTFLMTNKKSEKDNAYFKFQGDINLAGNFIHAAMLLANANNTNTIPYKIFGKEYAQFAKFEANIVQHFNLNTKSQFVARLNAGIIIPYGNSTVAPYFQQFYAGGPNSIRAFRLRALGPGGYQNGYVSDGTNYSFDQSGDIKLEANIEYRFDLWKWFKWAFFVDAGNVWLLNEDVDREKGVFTPQFYNDIAVGFGTGLRMDFSYFVIRTDLAMPVIDPSYELSERWRLNKINFDDRTWIERNLIFSLAIGYPF